VELYKITETELFNILRDSYYPDLLRTDDTYSAGDCYSDDFSIIIELKCRQTHYDKLMIEKLKYDRLKELADSMGYIPIYICSTPEGIWEFNLDTLKVEWTELGNLPATTQFENTDKVNKMVGFLPISAGKSLFPDWPESLQPEDEWLVDNFDKFYAEDAWVDPMEQNRRTTRGSPRSLLSQACRYLRPSTDGTHLSCR
jgi:hypothetical protein